MYPSCNSLPNIPYLTLDKNKCFCRKVHITDVVSWLQINAICIHFQFLIYPTLSLTNMKNLVIENLYITEYGEKCLFRQKFLLNKGNFKEYVESETMSVNKIMAKYY